MGQSEQRSGFKLTNQELHLEVVIWDQRSIEGDINNKLLTPSDHQLVGHVLVSEVVRLIELLLHVDVHHVESV